MARYDKIERPTEGTRIARAEDGSLEVPPDPVVPFIEGDGVGPEVFRATRSVLDAAVDKAFRGKRRIQWFEVYGGDKAAELYGEGTRLPEDTLQAVHEYGVALAGPMAAPAGARPPSVTLRQRLDLFARFRPLRHYPGVPSPSATADRLDLVLFRETSEDATAGLEVAQGSDEAKRLIAFLRDELGQDVRRDAAVGIKAISVTATRRLVRQAIRYAVGHKLTRVTLVHDGAAMPGTEGAFRDFGYQLAKDELPELCLTEDEVWDRHGGKVPKGKVMVNDRPAGTMIQALLMNPGDYQVLAAPSVLGAHLADLGTALAGGPGLAPAASFGEVAALFEAPHGPEPQHVGTGEANPGALILSGKLLLAHLGWDKAAALVEKGVAATLAAGIVTSDLAPRLEGSTPVSCAGFAEQTVKHMD